MVEWYMPCHDTMHQCCHAMIQCINVAIWVGLIAFLSGTLLKCNWHIYIYAWCTDVNTIASLKVDQADMWPSYIGKQKIKMFYMSLKNTQDWDESWSDGVLDWSNSQSGIPDWESLPQIGKNPHPIQIGGPYNLEHPNWEFLTQIGFVSFPV